MSSVFYRAHSLQLAGIKAETELVIELMEAIRG